MVISYSLIFKINQWLPWLKAPNFLKKSSTILSETVTSIVVKSNKEISKINFDKK